MHLRSASAFAGVQSLCEGLRNVGYLRTVMQPTYPLELHVNIHAATRLTKMRPAWRSLWDSVRPLSLSPELHAVQITRRTASARASEPYLYKLAALMNTAFSSALFLDNDIRVIDPSLVHALLTSGLRVSDVAMPLDPGRGAWASQQPGLEVAPFLCTCVLAYRSTPAVRAWWRGAAARLVEARHPHVRQTDQEMIWHEWVANRSELRVLPLPEEWYCPLQPGTADSTWHTSGYPARDYPCKSTHVHSVRVHIRSGGGGCS